MTTLIVKDPVLIHLWHPVLLSNELNEQPKAIEILGEKVVVFRTSQGVYAFKDLCIHRGVPLSLGKVVNDEIICPYHGWTYNSCGTCTRIPALPEGKAIPTKAKTITYYCTEELGFIWVCLGEPDMSKPKIGELTSDRSQNNQVKMGPYELEAAGPRVIENFLDVSHLMFVHEGLLGDSQFPEISDYQVYQKDGVLISDEIDIYQPDPDGRGHGVHAKYTYKVFQPLCAGFRKSIDDSDEFFDLYLIVLPINEKKSKAYMVMERNYALEEDENIFIQFQDLLIEQDRIIVENQKPELLPLDLQAELHLKSDRVSIAYRKFLMEVGLTFGTE
ncbi:aromatic ring-hydroxylating oxygenase subunit alpha [Metabacillus halosaccharovorans]|uniref:aromatic ring-hydroxylating dioxygenase subunit alpha n=1 Tax=Metabacillus halosaccharovorans TaxID=930124 RepID=UPI00111661B5|nr:aromatic ring-hydroxylating dioxygenase subunit alpha [Metabacillus halosaccharovorans]